MMKRTLMCVLVFSSACLDFDEAKQRCLAENRCLGQLASATVTSTSPANQATDVRVTTSIQVTFSKPMDRTSVGKPTMAPAVVLSDVQWTEDSTSFVVQPVVPLEYGTRYSLTVNGHAQDGASLAEGSAFSFTTQAMPDVTGPTLASTTPSNGLNGVDINTHLSLTFSEAMSRDSLDVSTAPPLGLGVPTWATDFKSVTFETPLDTWAQETTYVVQVAANDLSGNALQGAKSFSFKTAKVVVPDTTPPTIITTAPANGTVGIDVGTTVSVTFSEPVTPTSAAAAFSMSPSVACTPVLDPSGTLLSCAHSAPFQQDAGYTMTIGTEVKDLAGNSLASPVSVTFKTGVVPDTTRPTIVSVAPLEGATAAGIREPLVVTFSEPMDQAATQGALAISSPVGVSLAFSWSADGRTLTSTPTTDLPYGANVRWQVAATAQDLAGNTLMSTQSYQFQVRHQTTVSLALLSSGGTTANSASDGLFVGDNIFNQEYRAFVAYELPANALAIQAATLTMYQFDYPSSYPFASARIDVDFVAYSSPIDNTEATGTALCSGASCITATCHSTSLSTTASGQSIWVAKVANVLGATQAALALPTRQFAARLKRVSPPSKTSVGCADFGSDADGVGDYVRFAGPTEANPPVFTITYTYP